MSYTSDLLQNDIYPRIDILEAYTYKKIVNNPIYGGQLTNINEKADDR